MREFWYGTGDLLQEPEELAVAVTRVTGVGDPAGGGLQGGEQGGGPVPVGFQNSATGLDLGIYAARSYSLMRPRMCRRLIRFLERSATG